jgi:hypothetical protein
MIKKNSLYKSVLKSYANTAKELVHEVTTKDKAKKVDSDKLVPQKEAVMIKSNK